MYEADISIMNVVQFVENQIENKPSAKLSTEDVTTGNHEEKIIPEEQNSRPEKEGMQKSLDEVNKLVTSDNFVISGLEDATIH